MIVRFSVAAVASVALHGAALAWVAALPRVSMQHGVHGEAALRQPLKVSFETSAPSTNGVPAPSPRKAVARAAGPALPAPVYYRLSELDERPQVRVHVEPRFPPDAPVSEGKLRVHLYIGEDGAVDKLELSDAEPAGVFERAAAQAFAAAKFTPGKKAGIPVRSRMSIEVLFGAPAPTTQQAAAFTAPR